MDVIKFQNEITDMLGNTPTGFLLKTIFRIKYELLNTAGEIRIRTKMPLCIIGGNKKEKIFSFGHPFHPLPNFLRKWGNKIERGHKKVP